VFLTLPGEKGSDSDSDTAAGESTPEEVPT
jgi:hypothetical protein